MSNRILRFAVLPLLCLTIAGPAFAAPAKRHITEKDLFDFVWIGSPQISPDGSRVAYVRVKVDKKKTGYETAIWVVSTNGKEAPRQFTSGPHDSGPRWSPDGKSLVFTRSAEKDGKKQPPQLCLLSLGGGDAFIFTDLPKGAGDPKWSPDGRSILFTSTSNPEDLAKQAEEKSGKKKPEEHESDVHVITRAVYRNNEEGYLDPTRPAHLWIVQAPLSGEEKVAPRPLTSGRFSEHEAFWSKDGAQVYFASLHVAEPYYDLPKTQLYVVPANGGNAKLLTTIPMGVHDLALSPDGKEAAFVAAKNEPVRSYTEADLWTLALTPNAKPVCLTSGFDYGVGDSVFGDNSAPRAFGSPGLTWSADGRSILDIYAKEGETQLASFDSGNGAVTGSDAWKAGSGSLFRLGGWEENCLSPVDSDAD